ncbi:MAG TPA: mercury(II) reductase [Ktedonobacterales bacterium]|nr:mercury(II) reductase [Ktedonobacterales bacterium]
MSSHPAQSARSHTSSQTARERVSGGGDHRDHYDLLILGSGSTAFAAAIRAKDLGKTAVMTEARTLGGACVNRGCLPSKNLIAAAKLVYDARHPRYPGLTPVEIPVDFRALIAQKDEVIAGYREQHYASMLSDDAHEASEPNPVQVVEGRATLVDAHTAEVITPDGTARRLSGEQVLIATGSHPVIPDLPGLSETPYLTSDLLTSQEAMELRELPESLLIIGSGYIALELGQLFARLGAQVTIVARSGHILKDYEPEVSSTLTQLLRDEGIHVLTRATIVSIRGDERQVTVSADVRGQRQELSAAKLLVATGRAPTTGDIGVERVGVQLDARGAVIVDEELRTSVPHIWAAGDVIGDQTESQMATPVGARDGGIAASNALTGAHQRVNHQVIPRAIFTDPQVGVVGLTDREANAAGIVCTCNSIPLSAVPRAGAIRDTRGMVKMVLEAKTRRIVGVSMVGADAAEVIQIAATAMRFNATADDLIEQIFVYPTMAEALKIVAISFTRDVGTLSCCAS